MFHKETARNKSFLVDDTGAIKLQLTQSQANNIPQYIAYIIKQFKKYLKDTGEQIDIRTYITDVYVPHKLDPDKDKREKVINQLKSISDNNPFIYGKLEVDGNFVRLYKWPDEKAVRIVDIESNQLVRVNLSKLEKVEDGVYKMPYYATPKSI